MATVFPEETSSLITHANNQRFEKSGDDKEKETIHVSDEWMNLLNHCPYKSQKKGKFIHLLKSGSKVREIKKVRKTYDVFDIFSKL